MERRDFLKLSAAGGATAALSSCGHPEQELIRFIAEEDLQPGVAVWRPSVCTMCPAGCGLTVRVMEGDAEVVRHGQHGLIKMGLAKKLEGNPDHPINRGKLCGRGQAGLQVTYHPERVRTPLRRRGPRGSGQFDEITWEEALQALVLQLDALLSAQMASSLAFLTRSRHGQRGALIDRFMAKYGSKTTVTFDLFDDDVLRRANLISFGRGELPTLDLARADYILSLGADFLGTWNSPVAQAIGYGEMRQGRPGARGQMVQVEPRLSQTGANADEWIPIRPGTEGILALGIAHLSLGAGSKPLSVGGPAQELIAHWQEGLPDFTPEEVEKTTGVPAKTLTRIANEFGQSGRAAAVIGGAPLAHTNGLFSALAVNALDALVGAYGNADSPGILSFAPQASDDLPSRPGSENPAGSAQVAALVAQIATEQPDPVKALLIYEANPVFATPPGFGVREALEKIPFIASFGSFIDETSVLADLILPDHSPLESWIDVVAESGSDTVVTSLAGPAVRPLHDTRAMPDVLLEVAHRLGGAVSDTLPWKSFEEVLHSAFDQLTDAPHTEEQWNKAVQKGWWNTNLKQQPLVPARSSGLPSPVQLTLPKFDGNETEFPFHFLPYASQAFWDGSAAHLPWMQELPDVLSSAMWSVWVEINPQTAGRLNIQQGDLVEVASQHGKLHAPAFLYPAIAPDVVAMPVGQGHEHFTRYASGRGANPISILAPLTEESVGALAWAATRVNIRRVGDGKNQLILFGGGMREEGREKR